MNQILLIASFWDTIKGPFVDFWNRVVESGPKWLVALVILVVALILAKLLRKLVEKIVGRTSTQGHVHILIARAAGAVVIGIGIILALGQLGMSLSAALAAAGLASVGIGFALQDILSNMFAGIILLLQHPFTIGDQVRVGLEEGVVENVRIRDTQILTWEGERVYIPNKTVFNSPIINYTSTPALRIDVRMSIRYEEDIDRARYLAYRVMRQSKGVLEQPEPMVLVEPEAESVVLVCRFWMGSDRNRRLVAQSEVSEGIIREFERVGITIPYPIRTLEFRYPRQEEANAPAPGETQVIERVPPEEDS